MKSGFTKYMKHIGLTEVLQGRVEEIYQFYRGFCPEKVSDVFITDLVKADGTREYENLWFFSPNYVMEAKLFAFKDDFDMTPHKGRIQYLEVQKESYDCVKATDASRMYVNITLDTHVVCEWKASRENCDHLWRIVMEHLKPNLKR